MTHKLFYIVYFTLCITLFSSCRKFVYDNPVDPSVKLPAPTNVTATLSADTSVTLKWSYVQKYLYNLHFEIERKIDNGNFVWIGNTAKSKTTFTHSDTFSTTKTYYYRIRAAADKNRGGYSQKSFQLNFSPPTNLTITSFTDTQVGLQWSDNSNFETGFLLEQKEDNNAFLLIDSTPTNVTSKVVNRVFLTSHIYTFRVRAKSKNNISSYSDTITQTLSFPAPTNLTITSFTDTQVGLQWSDNSNFEMGFEIEQSTDSVNFSVVSTVGTNVTTATNNGTYLVSNRYFFRVKAVTNNNTS